MIYRWGFLISVLMIASGAALSSCKSPLPPQVVAEIDGDTVTVAEFSAELRPFLEGYHTPPSAQEEEALENLKQALLDQLIEKRLILKEARTMGITVSDDELEETFATIKGSYPQGGFDEVVTDEAVLRRWKERLHQRQTRQTSAPSPRPHQRWETTAEPDGRRRGSG